MLVDITSRYRVYEFSEMSDAVAFRDAFGGSIPFGLTQSFRVYTVLIWFMDQEILDKVKLIEDDDLKLTAYEALRKIYESRRDSFQLLMDATDDLIHEIHKRRARLTGQGPTVK